MRAKLVVLEVGGDLERNFGRGTYDKRGKRERIFEREREKKGYSDFSHLGNIFTKYYCERILRE